MLSALLKGLQQSSPNLIKDALPPCLRHLFTFPCEWEEQSLGAGQLTSAQWKDL